MIIFTGGAGGSNIPYSSTQAILPPTVKIPVSTKTIISSGTPYPSPPPPGLRLPISSSSSSSSGIPAILPPIVRYSTPSISYSTPSISYSTPSTSFETPYQPISNAYIPTVVFPTKGEQPKTVQNTVTKTISTSGFLNTIINDLKAFWEWLVNLFRRLIK